MAAVVADHAFFQYERTLQREYNPELIIHLPSPQSQPSTENALALVSVSMLWQPCNTVLSWPFQDILQKVWSLYGFTERS